MRGLFFRIPTALIQGVRRGKEPGPDPSRANAKSSPPFARTSLR